MLKKLIFTLVLAFAYFTNAMAQEQSVEMADAMRANGKIYVVVAVIVVLFVGLLTYIIALDRKISKLEKELANK